MKYRHAKIPDIPSLVEIENACFNYDQLDARRFRYFIKKDHDDLIIQCNGNEISGYGLLLYRKGTSLCRLYSIAISQKFQGQGLGKELLMALEGFARQKDSTYIRLEVKASNQSAINLYKKLGYINFSIKHQYYENSEDAICFEKKIQFISKKEKKLTIPFYQQTTEFTCGPSSLMMAMKSLNPKFKLNRIEEIQIWREATTIFMTAGHGGCGPHGLALAANRRGFRVDLYLSTKELLFVSGVRQKIKKDIIKLVQDQFDKEIKAKKIPVLYKLVDWTIIEEIFKKGGIPLFLISSYRLTESKTPHWIVLTGMNDDFVFFNDPFIDDDDSILSNTNIPVRRDEFESMARFGSNQIKSCIVLYN